jgi:hypothetical protein
MQVIVELNFHEPDARKNHHCATGAFLFCWRWIESKSPVAGHLKWRATISFTNDADVSQHH